VAAIVLGLRARQDLTGRWGSGIAIASIVIAALMIVQMSVRFAVEVVS